ncbi:MAG: YraN family protein [Atribacterota bacterium]|jgi:putative endonuclease|nr:YraN family protein [Atribacterota bacterium]MDD4896180.1 YraN family protein [Atribacterota bacterium]MDD5637661.1 YraN family protein [Atribacterota bacterium]
MNNTGNTGEKFARYYLNKKGYRILEQNYKVSFGEIDIIAEKNNCICFIEVKSRRSNICGSPEESITQYKKNKIIKVAELYIKQRKIKDKLFRFDVIALNFNNNFLIKINHITNAFHQ